MRPTSGGRDGSDAPDGFTNSGTPGNPGTSRDTGRHHTTNPIEQDANLRKALERCVTYLSLTPGQRRHFISLIRPLARLLQEQGVRAP